MLEVANEATRKQKDLSSPGAGNAAWGYVITGSDTRDKEPDRHDYKRIHLGRSQGLRERRFH
eukprot:8734418-Pyramimonas_sp.AAC.2